MSKHTIRECLQAIGIASDDDFSDCTSLTDEYRVLRRKSNQVFLSTHPDKGGDVAAFRRARTSFEVLRDLYDTDRIRTFRGVVVQEQSVNASYETTFADFADMPTPSWDYYYAAASEIVPVYRVEQAKSGRSQCRARGPGRTCGTEDDPRFIPVGTVRIGSMQEETGSYTRFVHLECWRVPNRVWEGLPDPDQCDDRDMFVKALLAMNEVVLSGFSELREEQQRDFVDYIMDKKHWARKTKHKRTLLMGGAAASANEGPDGTVATGQNPKSSVMVPAKGASRERFRVPVPGRDGATANALEGKTVVLTGLFPEVGGGIGLNLGKDRVKSMIQSFGGRVTGSVSGRTDILVVGKDPGFSKVSSARTREKCQLISLKGLADVLHGKSLEHAPPPAMVGFSAGYGGNSLADRASARDLALANGTLAVPQIPDKDTKSSLPTSKKHSSKDGENKPSTKRTKRAATKKMTTKQKKNAEPPVSIKCDGCGVDCTKQSWFVPATEEDFCPNCHKTIMGHGVPQINGETVEKVNASVVK